MLNDVSIRSASAADASALTAFARRTYRTAFGATFQPADLVAYLDRALSFDAVSRFIADDAVLLASRGPEIIGYIQFGDAAPRDGVGVIDGMEVRRLYVAPEHQNSKVGSTLMDAALQHPRLCNARRIYLEVWEHNFGAQRFYVRYGFRTIGARMFTVASGANMSHELLMVRVSP